MKPIDIAFLRELGMPEDALFTLANHQPTSITGQSLASWLRFAWLAGRRSARDPYVWRTVAELLDDQPPKES